MLAILRILTVGKLIAAKADASGIVLHGIFTTRFFAWSEIEDVKLQESHARGAARHAIVVQATGRRDGRLSLFAISGGVNAARSWLAELSSIPHNDVRREH